MNAGIFDSNTSSFIGTLPLDLSHGTAMRAGGVSSRATYFPNRVPLEFSNFSVDNEYFVACQEMSRFPNTLDGSSGYRVALGISTIFVDSPIFIHWGDGSVSNYGVGSPSALVHHVYSSPGPYFIKVKGQNITRIGVTNPSLVSITQIFSFPLAMTSLATAFRNATNQIEIFARLPSSTTSLNSAFVGASRFNYNLSHWNTANVNDFTTAFFACSSLNQPFNSWNISSTNSLSSMFQNCSILNQSFDGWNTSNISNFSSMFSGCTLLNQDFSSWNFNSCTTLNAFMTGVTLNTVYYDALLILWDTFKTTWFNGGTNMSPNMGSSKYSAGAAATARANLITKGWSITDGGPA